MSNIFLLELYVQELKLWKQPLENLIKTNECYIDFIVLDKNRITFSHQETGLSWKNRKNCLFTLDSDTINANDKIKVEVYNKSNDQSKIIIGIAEIPMQKRFHSIFDKIRKTTQKGLPEKLSLDKAKVVYEGKLIKDNSNDSKKSPLFDSANLSKFYINNSDISEIVKDISFNVSSPHSLDPAISLIEDFPENIIKLTDFNKNYNEKTIPALVDDVDDPTNASHWNPENIITYPLFDISKALYPILATDNIQIGVICILIKFTCYGPSTVLPELRSTSLFGESQMEKSNIKQPKPLNSCYHVESIKSNDLISDYENCIPINPESHIEKYDIGKECLSDDDVCPCPNGSLSSICNDCTEFEEYKVQNNDNMLIIKVPKNSKQPQIKRVYKAACNQKSKAMKKISIRCNENEENLSIEVPTKPQGKFQNSFGIPIIKGNLKYPAYYGTGIKNAGKNTTSLINKCLQTTELNTMIANCEKASDHSYIPTGIEICKKDSLEDKDIFILKMGTHDELLGNNEIELELHTPKSPSTIRVRRETRSSQTVEEDFEDVNRDKRMNVQNINIEPKQLKEKTNKTGKNVKNFKNDKDKKKPLEGIKKKKPAKKKK